MTRKKPVNVNEEVRRVEQRVTSMEGLQKFMIRVQLDQLTNAEKLRKLAIAAVNAPSDASKRMSLEMFVMKLEPFTVMTPRLRAKLAAFVDAAK